MSSNLAGPSNTHDSDDDQSMYDAQEMMDAQLTVQDAAQDAAQDAIQDARRICQTFRNDAPGQTAKLDDIKKRLTELSPSTHAAITDLIGEIESSLKNFKVGEQGQINSHKAAIASFPGTDNRGVRGHIDHLGRRIKEVDGALAILEKHKAKLK